MNVVIKRVYEDAAASDGYRVLIDRLWPRGLSKERAAIDEWLKDAAPSAELRRSWHADSDGHSPEHFEAFANDYLLELTREPAASALEHLAQLAREHDTLTLLYGARDPEVNHAVVLRDALIK